MPNQFLSFSRSGVHDLNPDARAAGRRQVEISLELEELGGEKVGGAAPFELLGPLDVAGLLPQAIARRVPEPGSIDATETRAAHAELEPPDLPWRYTPFKQDAAHAVAPWLVLVVAKDPQEVAFLGSKVQLSGAALSSHPLARSSRWAHVHELEHTDGTKHRLARLLSPRDLESDTDYAAVLVPAYVEDGGAEGIRLAWGPGDGQVLLPWYDRWSFRTGPQGDFEELASRLEPVAEGEPGGDFGIARVHHRELDPDETLPMRAALASIPRKAEPQPDADPPPAPVVTATRAATDPIEVDGRWVLTVPDYGEPWPGSAAAAWREDFHEDPRRRGAAGLGAWAGIEWQERIVDAAAAQAGALAIAAERIRHLTLGLAATRSAWARRYPVEPLRRLMLLGPALGRIPTEGENTVLAGIDGRVPGRLVPELFSSAARRVLRAGPARTALAAPGAADPVAVLVSANRCPEREPPDDVFVDSLDALGQHPAGARALGPLIEAARDRLRDDEPARQRLDQVLDLLPGWVFGAGAFVPPDVLVALDPGDDRPPDLDRLADVVRGLPREGQPVDRDGLKSFLDDDEPIDDCLPFALDDLAGRIVAGVDPHVERPVAVDRVIGRIKGLKEPVLAPPDLSPELDLPLWKFLDERERDWLLPGVGLLEPDRVVMVQTNPAFVDAFLVGANQQSLGELRWRNLPVETGWTPLRRFWSRIPDPKDDVPNTDVNGVLTWPQDSHLGDPRHRTDPVHGEDLVVVFRTDLFRRYPSTLVYLFTAAPGGGAPDWQNVPANMPEADRLYPVFAGKIGPEVTFFGFRATPAQGRTHWIVLEEPPPGFRFRCQPPPGEALATWQAKVQAATNGAEFAEKTYAKPVRVFLGNVLP